MKRDYDGKDDSCCCRPARRRCALNVCEQGSGYETGLRTVEMSAKCLLQNLHIPQNILVPGESVNIAFNTLHATEWGILGLSNPLHTGREAQSQKKKKDTPAPTHRRTGRTMCPSVFSLQSSHRCLFQPTVIVPHAHWEAYGVGSLPVHNLVSDSANPHYVPGPLPQSFVGSL